MKPIHKRIGSRVWKYQRHFTKYLYERDTVFATLWVFAIIIVLGLIPTKNLYFLNPLKRAFEDFELNDITYADKLGKSKQPARDPRIVIVNIGHADREELAMIIEKTRSMGPKVIALDALFYGERDFKKDSLLNESFAKTPSLVAAHKLVLSGEEGDTISLDGNHFKSAHHYGNVNFFNDELTTTRTFEPWVSDYSGNIYPFFSSEVVRLYDSSKYKHLMQKKGKVLINYLRTPKNYLVVDYQKLLFDNSVDDTVFRNKIVLLGYISDNPYDIEDKKFTPLNEKIAGKTLPDMNGIVVHANIISMILDNNYIKKLPSWVTWLLAILIGWLHMSFFIRYYLENHIWFHLVAKIAQLASAIIFAYLGMLVFERYNIKLDMKLSLIVIVMAVDVIYFYEAFAVWMHNKFHYQTLFHQKHH